MNSKQSRRHSTTANPVGITHDVGATPASPLQNDDTPTRPRGPQRQSVASIVGSFRSAVTKRINEHRRTLGATVWQRDYFEHIIRNDESLNRIRQYILNNPMQWELDRENPVRVKHFSPQQKHEPWRI
jgi:hypothetical protein